VKSKRVDLWETPVFFVENPEHEKIYEGLCNFIYEQEAKQSTSIDSNVAPHLKRNLSESRFDFLDRDNKHVQKLSHFIEEAALEHISDLNRNQWERKYSSVRPVIDIYESWYHVTSTGGHHGVHAHPGCSWCGIYYVDVGDRMKPSFRNQTYSCFDESLYKTAGGKNRFYSPFNVNYYDPGMDWFMTNDTYAPEPVNGLFILFPSYLMHCGEIYLGDKKRVLIAMNMKVELINETI